MGYGIYEIVFLNCVIGALSKFLIVFELIPRTLYIYVETHENLFW